MSKTYTLAEVNQHHTRDDLWLVIDNKVYNITDFVLEHPGGEAALFEEAGKDATESFDNVDHTEEARELLDRYLIGTIVESKCL
ncbi:unnamed protein product [Cunninghamella blakesleeana]